MKKIKEVVGLALILFGFAGMIACAIAYVVFHLKNPDMTSLRMFLEYPEPSIWCIVDYIGVQVGMWMVKN